LSLNTALRKKKKEWRSKRTRKVGSEFSSAKKL
jgi:hypothetical protein